ncbi:MAG: NAD-dependent deacylase [Anaerolineae bacterium]|jgi:NAD-dependent deacetylase
MNAIQQVARLLRISHYPVALTGAGMSTPSGIPDFRSPESGLWEKVDPMQVASIYAFRRHPEAFYDWMRPLAQLVLQARANPGHLALAELEALGYLRAIITQNIDNLHQQAGSTEVLEIHGHVREATCIDCYHVQSTEDLSRDFLMSEAIPRCLRCGGVMKPNAVLFGEQLPVDVYNAAIRHLDAADLLLIAGSSLEVVPVCRLPSRVYRQGGRLIVINLTPTMVDDVADVVIRGDVAEVLPRVAQACRA